MEPKRERVLKENDIAYPVAQLLFGSRVERRVTVDFEHPENLFAFFPENAFLDKTVEQAFFQ